MIKQDGTRSFFEYISPTELVGDQVWVCDSSVKGEDRGLSLEASVIREDRGLREKPSVIGEDAR